MQRKTCRSFLFLCRTHRQVFNFYNGPPCRLWSWRRVGGRSSDFLCHKLDALTRDESAILTNLPRKLVPSVRFLKDQQAQRENGERATALSKVQHRCQAGELKLLTCFKLNAMKTQYDDMESAIFFWHYWLYYIIETYNSIFLFYCWFLHVRYNKILILKNRRR